MRRQIRTVRFMFSFVAAISFSPFAWAANPPAATDARRLEFFEKKIRPILVDNCYTCHSADTNSKGGLRVDDRVGLVQGGKNGPAVVPGDPARSLLIKAVEYKDPHLQMPPKKQLSAEEIEALKQWIEAGAAWPAPVHHDGGDTSDYARLRKEHWAWQPLKNPSEPAVKDPEWPVDPIDQFILARLETAGLTPVAGADKHALIRRVSFDLTGLPPTPAEIDAFVSDESPKAFETVVDRLLASPGFGERWGRHWLDVARYGESTGPSRNMPYPHAWRYRDYVIDSLNRDKPYDQFVREQIAGDLLPAESTKQRDEFVVATGFLALGGKDVNQRFKVRFTMDNIDEQIDTVSRSVLGLTVSCARCHHHKYDPIPASDYYALAGIFHSTEICAGLRSLMGGGGLDYYDPDKLVILGPPKTATADEIAAVDKTKKELAKARSEMVAIRDDPDNPTAKGEKGDKALKAARKKIDRIQSDLVRLTDPAANGPVAIGVRDAKNVGDTELRVRGEAEKLGPIVPRGFLGVLEFPGQPQIDPNKSGRLELAQWLAHPNNPITARVIVNRVWQHLFDRGLVQTVDNFGVTGDVPSHPELLDHLATRFIADGWSIKRLARAIVLSRAYRLGSDANDANLAADPANRLVWRHTPRRLDAEEIRDATLAAAGVLANVRPEASPAKDMKVIELRDSGPEAKKLFADARSARYRSVYLPLLRGLTPTSLAVFDFAEQGMVNGARETTTVPTQSLYLLNDPFVFEQSRILAERLLADIQLDNGERLNELYRLTLGRAPTRAEIRQAREFLSDYKSLVQQELADGPVTAVAATMATGDRPTTTSSAPSPNPKPKSEVEQNPDNVDRAESESTGADEKTAVAPPQRPRPAAWTSLCQAIFASAEFRYLK